MKRRHLLRGAIVIIVACILALIVPGLLPARQSATQAAGDEFYGADQDLTLLRSNNVTDTVTSGRAVRPPTAKGGYLVWDIATVLSSTTQLTLTLDAYDIAQADYYTLYTAGPYTSAQELKWLFYPEATDTGSALTGIVKVPLPSRYRVQIEAGDAVTNRTYTCTVSMSYVP